MRGNGNGGRSWWGGGGGICVTLWVGWEILGVVTHVVWGDVLGEPLGQGGVF